MLAAEPLVAGWKARLQLGFRREEGKTVLRDRRSDGPLVVQKPFYPEGDAVCHAIIVHPPGGIAGGDALALEVSAGKDAAALLTTPGAGKWYRSAGPLATQHLAFGVRGALEWLPRETIVFDGARAELACRVDLGPHARYIGWDVVCLGRTGSGERFERGRVKLETSVTRDGRPLWFERGTIDGGARLAAAPAGLGGAPVFGTLIATLDVPPEKLLLAACREIGPTTCLPGLLVARYLGDSSEAALRAFEALWKLLRPSVLGRHAVPPRIWST